MAGATLDTIKRLRCQILQHCPHSQELVPFTYVFEPLKEDLRGRQFENDDKVTEPVHFWLKACFSNGKRKLCNGLWTVLEMRVIMQENEMPYACLLELCIHKIITLRFTF